MRPFIQTLSTVIVVAHSATHAVDARTHHRAPKVKAPAVTPPAANIPEKNRDPADVALDRKIKGICKGR